MMKNICKIASLLFAAVMLFAACGEKQNPDGGETGGAGAAGTQKFYMLADKDVIQSNGTDISTLTVYLDGQDVTSEAVIYNEKDEPVSLADGKFTVTKDGEYKFWASYGTYMTKNKDLDDNGLITVKAISVAVPSVAEDLQKSNTSFVHRAFLTQYTGIRCGYCPYMIKILKQLIADKTIPDKAVLVACHSGYNQGDPAAISAPQAPGGNYPYLHIGMAQGFNHTQGASVLYSLINSNIASDAAAGISANPVLYEDGTLVVRVSVKAAVDGNFRVGAWLLEDDIYAAQEDYDNVGDESYDTHNNCVRLIDSRYDGLWAGKHLGEIKAGKTAEKTFVMKVKLTGSKPWKKENLHLALIVSKEEKDGFAICNAVDVPIDKPTLFEYK